MAVSHKRAREGSPASLPKQRAWNGSLVPGQWSSPNSTHLPVGPFPGQPVSPTTPNPSYADGTTFPLPNDIADINDVWKSTPLPPKDRKKIRLLKLHGGDESDLTATLKIRNGPEPYEALSYYWGTDERTSTLSIYAKEERYKVPITPNLETALRQLRPSSGSRLIWIDALCINQDDHKEKNIQLPNMASVYNEAFNVCVSLGKGDKDTEEALTFVKDILDLDDFERLILNSDRAKAWRGLFGLMTRPWFSRRWVVQEIALARKATVYCGDTGKVKWRDFANAVALFGSRHRQIDRLVQAAPDKDSQSFMFGDITALSAYRLVQESSNLFRKSDDGKIQEHLRPLETLVSSLSTFQATNPRDTIYAVLSLADDTGARFSVKPAAASIVEHEVPRTDIPEEVMVDMTPEQKAAARKGVEAFKTAKSYSVDYDKSFFEVSRDFMEFTIKTSKSLDMVCRPWAPATQEDLPSWISTLSSMEIRPGVRHHTRVKADTLVGLPATRKKTYNAARNFPLEHSNWRLGEKPRERSLFVRGFVLDVIKEKRLQALQGNVPFAWVELGRWSDTSALPPDAFWRTLVADRGPDGDNPPLYYQLACRHAFAQTAPGDDLNTERLIRINSKPEIVNEKVIVEYLQRVQSMIWMRRLAITKELDALALVPAETKKRDLVCILAGCSVPVILRPVGEDETQGVTRYRLIGECYIHGMMDGEAFRFLQTKKLNKELDEQEFELV